MANGMTKIKNALAALRQTQSGTADWAAAWRNVISAYKDERPGLAKLFDIDRKTGQYKNREQVALLGQILSDPSSAQSTSDWMKYFYGEDASRVADSALELRNKAGANGVDWLSREYPSPLATMPVNFSGRKDQHGSYPTGRPDPTKEARTNVDLENGHEFILKDWARQNPERAASVFAASYIPDTKLDAAMHEVLGHGLNNVPRRFRTDKQSVDGSYDTIPGSHDTWSRRKLYYVANDAELAAELGNLRKMVYRRTRLSPDGQAMDIADPSALRSFMDSYRASTDADARSYLPDTTRKMLDGLNYLENYQDSPDYEQDSEETRRAILDRKENIKRILENPDLMGQVVSNDVQPSGTDPNGGEETMADSSGGEETMADSSGGDTRAVGKKGGSAVNPKPYARQRLLDHIKKWEKMRLKPYLDVDGNYAIGYGSHFVGGKQVTKDTAAIDEATATAELAAYLTERENTLAKFIPNWGRIPSDRQDMLLDVAMGKRGILSAKTSSNLHRRLGATTDPAELSRIVDEEYPTYSWAGGKPSEGLANRRADGLNTLRVQQDALGGEARADAEGGDVGPTPGESGMPGETVGPEPIPPQPSGPRIVINPSTFRNRKDALCVAFNERFRIAMEQYGFEPKSEPTPAQRRFFADTAYADDEVQLRRTILARILTLDTSIS